MAFDRQLTLPTPTGARLNLLTQRAVGSVRGIIQINHGMAEHAQRYARFAGAAAGRGFHVYAHDHRGHGATVASDAPTGSFGRRQGTALVLDDLAAVHERIASDHPGLPIICFGHSMGALIALNFAFRHSDRIAALALWNGNFSPGLAGRLAKAMLAWERFRLGSDSPSPFMARMAFRRWAESLHGRFTDFDWLSHDANEVRRYIDDPLCGWNASVGLWRSVLEMATRGAHDANFSNMRRALPIHLQGGGQDPVTDYGGAVCRLAERLDALGFARVTCSIRRESRHESLHEIDRDRVTGDFLAWLEEIC